MNSADLDDAKYTEQVTDAVEYAIEHINALTPELRRKAVAMVNANFGLTLRDPPAARGYGYRPTAKRRYS